MHRVLVVLFLSVCALIALPESSDAQCASTAAGSRADKSTDPPATRRILILHQARVGGLLRSKFDAAFTEAVRSSECVSPDLYEETIERERFTTAEAGRVFRQYLKNKYEALHIDVIVAVGVRALTFAREHRALFGSPPIVANLAPVGQLDPTDGIIGLQGGQWISGTIDLALALLPETRSVYVVDGSRDNDGDYETEIRRQLSQDRRGLELVYLRDIPMRDLLPRIAAIPARSIVLFVRQSMRNESQDLDQFDGLTQVLYTSPVPVFTHREEFMGHGVIGGDMRQLALDASRMAEMALLIASGMSPRDIPVADNTYDVMVDWRQLQRWQIPESRVPANSEVLFRAPSFFEQYWRYLAAIGGLLMAQGAIIATLYIQRARRRESEARNMAILRAAPDIMFLQNRDGVYLDYHAPSQKCLFVPPEHFIGYNMREVLPPEVLAHVLPLFEQARDSDHMVVGEYALDIKGSRMYLEARLVRCGDDKVLSVVRDITERTRTQAALIESEERYALATAAGGAGVWDWNLENGHIYVDPRLNRLLGHEDDEMPMTCEEWRCRVHPDDLPMVSARTERHLAGDTPTYEAEHRLLHKDGSIRWVAVRGSVVREDERLVRLVGTYSDITDRKEADERLRQVQADLNRVSRLAASGEFAASIAHEVSQPLTAIIINARTCLRWLASPSPDLNEVRTTLSEVIDAGKRADGIIRRNRELFRHHSVKKLPLDLNDVVGEVALLAGAHLSAHRVRLETRLADELPAVLGDRIELCQLLLNLIANGIDAMQGVVKSRVVTVTSELTPERDVLVSVSDAGSGLTGVDMSRMFTTGYTTKPKGTGVGLSICRSIVEAHGGRMWATQNDGPGATFWFIVPSAADEEARPPRETQETAMLQ